MLLTAPFSIWPSGALSTFTDLFLKVVLVFVLLTHALSSPRLLRRFTWLIVIAMGYIAARGWIDYAAGTNLLQGRLKGAVPGLMGNPNDLAMNMVTFLPFAAFAALTRGKLPARLFAAVVTVLMIGAILFAKSRGGFLALAVTGLLIVIQSGRLRPGLVAAVLVGALVAPPLMPESFWTRVSSIVNAEDDATGSREARVVLLQDGWNAFVDHPFTGVGAGQFQNYNPPTRQELWRETHNVELQVLSELGLIGFAAFAWLLVRSGRTLFTTWQALRPRRRPESAVPADHAFAPHERQWMQSHVAACVAAFGGWLVCAQFGSIGYYWTLYYVLALIVAGREILARRLEWAAGGVARGATTP
jgi:O-antigen ligase